MREHDLKATHVDRFTKKNAYKCSSDPKFDRFHKVGCLLSISLMPPPRELMLYSNLTDNASLADRGMTTGRAPSNSVA